MLAIPYAYLVSGIGLALVVLVVITAISLLSAMFVIESQARAQKYTALCQTGAHGMSGGALNINGAASGEEAQPLLDVSEGYTVAMLKQKFETVDMVRIFFGDRAKIAYLLILSVYFYSSLWAYAAVFTLSAASEFPLSGTAPAGQREHLDCGKASSPATCEPTYLVYLAIFTVVVVPLAIMDLTTQWLIQFLLTVLRYVTIALMILIPVIGMLSDRSDSQMPDAKHGPYVVSQHGNWFRFQGLSVVIASTLYSSIFHHSIPGIFHPLRLKGKTLSILLWSIGSIAIIYGVLGTVAVLYFGRATDPSANLNYKSFRYGVAAGKQIPWWGQIFNYLLVLFPCFNFLTHFPLLALTLGNSMLATLPEAIKGLPDTRRRTTVTIACKLLASLPPIVAASFIRNLSQIISYAACLTITIAIVVPAALFLQSERTLRRALGPQAAKTPYYWPGSNPTFAWITLGLSTCFYAAFVANLVFKPTVPS